MGRWEQIAQLLQSELGTSKTLDLRYRHTVLTDSYIFLYILARVSSRKVMPNWCPMDAQQVPSRCPTGAQVMHDTDAYLKLMDGCLLDDK